MTPAPALDLTTSLRGDLQIEAKMSLLLPKTALELAENGQMKGNSGYSTHATRLPRAKEPCRAL